MLACIIFSLFASSPPVVNPDAVAVSMVWSYIGELVFNMLVLVGKESLPTKERILRVCVRLFLEQGYRKTTVSDIVQQANVSNSSFQHFYRAKDGVLTELVRFMYENQFDIARHTAGTSLPAVYVYAIETSIQIALTELNEHIREIYLEAYSHDEALHYIHEMTAKELYRIFGPYQPELSEPDFYTLELGTAGLMRGYMAHPCNSELPLEKKLNSFLSSSLRVYRVPEDELQEILSFIAGLDIHSISQNVMEKLFQTLTIRFEFSPPQYTHP